MKRTPHPSQLNSMTKSYAKNLDGRLITNRLAGLHLGIEFKQFKGARPGKATLIPSIRDRGGDRWDLHTDIGNFYCDTSKSETVGFDSS